MRSRTVAPALAVVAVALVAINLRPGASAVGPVLEEIRTGLGMSGSLAGALTGLPGFAFGLFGLTAVAVARRLGTTAGITLGLVVAGLGLLARPLVDSPAVFLLLSTLALAGMAWGNVLVPAWIKQHGGRAQVRLSTVYGTGLIVGGALGSLFTAPVLAATGSWRQALGVWLLPVLAALPMWLWLTRVEGRDTPRRADTDAPPSGRITASSTAVAMTVLFGLQSMHAYVQFGWLPQVYRDAGLSATTSGAMQALVAGTGIIGGLTMPTVIERARSLSPYVVAFGLLMAGGYLGLLFAPTALPWLWAVMLGIAGFAFPLALTLITARTRHAAVTARLSGFVQPVGYALAALGPLLVGVLHEATGGWSWVLALLAATALPFTVAGLYACRPVWVDDEL